LRSPLATGALAGGLLLNLLWVGARAWLPGYLIGVWQATMLDRLLLGTFTAGFLIGFACRSRSSPMRRDQAGLMRSL
jgi:hypothetical protein